MKRKNIARKFQNDLNQIDKTLVLNHAVSTLKSLLDLSELTSNQLAHLGVVGHPSIDSRAKYSKSAKEILTGIVSGSRFRSKLSSESVKAYLEKIPKEDRDKLLATIK